MSTQYRGTITSWQRDQGYGYITPDAGGPPVLFHNSALSRWLYPYERMRVLYTPTHDQQHTQAIHVYSLEESSLDRTITLSIVTTFFTLLILSIQMIALSPLVLIIYGISSLIALALFTQQVAQNAYSRPNIFGIVRLAVALLGGWPGALVAQELLRHRAIKRTHLVAFWPIVVLNLLALITYGGIHWLSIG